MKISTGVKVAVATLALSVLTACAYDHRDRDRGSDRPAAVECNDQTCWDARFHHNHYRYAGDLYWYQDNGTWSYWNGDRHCWAHDRDDWRQWRDDHKTWEDREWPADRHEHWTSCN